MLEMFRLLRVSGCRIWRLLVGWFFRPLVAHTGHHEFQLLPTEEEQVHQEELECLSVPDVVIQRSRSRGGFDELLDRVGPPPSLEIHRVHNDSSPTFALEPPSVIHTPRTEPLDRYPVP